VALEQAIISKMWLPNENRFASALYARDGVLRAARAETAQSLFPLLLESLPSGTVDTIVTSQLTNASRFWLNFPVPSVSAADPAFQPNFGAAGDLMWRGPTWPVLTWYVLQGLELHNRTSVAKALFGKWLACVEQHGIFEQYQPITGATFGPPGLSMSLLITDAICHFLPSTAGCF
jgi:glycogen debranching enzyme